LPHLFEPLNVLRMNDAIAETFRQHLLNRQTVGLERYSVYIDHFAIGVVDADHLRYGVDNAAKFMRILPDFLLRLLALGDIHRGPDKFYEVARLVQDRTPDGMEVLDNSIGKNDSVLHVKVGAFGRPLRKSFSSHLISILGMNALGKRFV